VLYVNDDNSIRLTRGDTARFLVPITNDLTGTTYELTDSDKLTLTIKKKETDSQPLVQKVLTGSNSFHILPSDTKNLSFGKYVYDVELTTEAGDVYTVIEPTTFELLKEVTW
jgi:hypothetical protein